ncbi:MAG: hypothetical protein KQH79_03710 [Bacteroidetes bacterium]|nr:hypothetical protein [Bacteroidota bacterium]
MKFLPYRLFILLVILSLASQSVFSQTIIFSDDFETDKGWTYSAWIRDNTSFSGSDGNHCHITPFNNYTNYLSAIVTSPIIDFTGYTTLNLSLDVRYNTEADWDGFRVEYSDNGGSTWNVLGAVGDGANWYNDNDVNAIGNNEHGWSGDNAAWETASISLPASLINTSNVQIRVRFESDAFVVDEGIAFDNFEITGVEIPIGNSADMVYWLRGDLGVTETSGTVTNWADQSGNGNDATDANGPTQITFAAMNNQEVMSFDGTNDALGIGDDARINTSEAFERTMFIAFTTGANVSTTQYLYEEGGNTNGIGVFIKGGKLYVIFYNDGNTTIKSNIVYESVNTNTAYILSFNWDSGNLTALLNNSAFSNQTITGTMTSLKAHGADISIGHTGGNTRNETGGVHSGPDYFSGQIAELIYYDAALSEVDEVEINNYLGDRYGVDVSVDFDIYYSYQTGNWNQSSTWTHDPGGTTQTATDIPNSGDKVVILNGRTVSLAADVDSTNLDVTIREGGFINQSTFQFSAGLSALRGAGTFKLASVNYPTVTTNDFVNTDGGTTEYNNAADFTLPASQSNYYHLRINAPGVVATQLSDITLNGDLHIKQGTYRINDNTAARRKLTIQGDVLVDNGASLTVGTGVTNTTTDPLGIIGGTAPFIDYYDTQSHRVVLKGDFTNNGNVRFTNLNYPVFNSFPPTTVGATTGFATVYFMGATNNTLTCNGTTDFYNLVLDKGIDQTYKLTVYSTDYQNFRLFGANTAGGDGGGANPNLKKALWLRTGSLVLKGLTIIPSLSEGTCEEDGTPYPVANPNSDFYIPSNAALILDGSEVIVLSTADDYREINLGYGVSGGSGTVNGVGRGGCSSFSILGKLQINNGYFSTRESGGFITWDDASGQFEINGGIVDAKQYRSAGSSGGLASFIQTGGTFLLRGQFQRTPTAYASINDLKDFSTNTLNTTRSSSGLNGALGTFNINEAANVFSMSGGTISIYDVCGTAAGQNGAFEVFSDVANNSVTGGTVEIIPTAGASGTDATQYIIETTAELGNLTINRTSGTATVDINTYDITILEDLTITSGELDANDLDVSIGGDFIIENGTSYTPGANWTIFNGSGAQSFEMNTGAALNINKFKVDKPSSTVLTLAGTQNTLNVADSMMIITGTLADGGKTVNLAGSIATSYLYNSGVHTGSGSIVLNDDDPQIITGDGNGIFENIELNNTDGSTAPVSLGANTAINGVLTFSQDNLFDISTYKLNLGEDAAIINAGTNRFIQSAGNAGDGGLTKTYSASSNTFTFPIGAPSSSHVAAEYTPATLSFSSAPTVYGSITVVPVGYEHPNTTNKNRSLTYFWRTKSEGFTLGSAVINHAYTYSDNDVIDNGTTITEDEYVAATYDNASYTWTKYNVTDVVDGTNTIGGTGTALASLNYIDCEFTAGDDTPIADDPFGTPVVYYSRQTGLWTDTDTWTFNDTHSGASAGSIPGASDIVIIGGQDSVYLATNLTTPNTGVQNAATLKIEQGSALDIGYNYDCNFGIVLSHENGNGNFRITTDFTDRSDFIFPNGDFSDYNVNKGTTEFYSVNPNTNTYFVLPSNTNSYGTVILSPLDQSNIVFPNISEVTFYGDLITRGTNWESWFGLTWLTTAGYPAIIPKTVTVKGDLLLERGSLVYIGNNAIQQTVVVEGDVIIFPTSGIDVYAGGGQNSFANTLSIAGDLINNSNNTPAPSGGHAGSNARFYVNANRKIDLVFTGNSNSSITNTGTTPATGSAPNTILGYVSVNKGNSQATTLTVDIGGTLSTGLQDDWLTLENGTFRYEHDGDLRITEDSQFTIPSTAGLYINAPGNTVYLANDNVDNNDVYLNGKLTIIDGDVYIGETGAPNNNNDIEYSGGGNSEIDIRGGSLTVNGQIRRNPSTSAGILKYNQSGGDVTINGRDVLAENAKLEILNAGSEFNMSGGTLTIVRGGGDGTFGDLYLRPETSTVTGGEIIFNPTSAQNFIFDANVPIWDLTISANANVELLVSPLTVKNDLTIASGGTLDANIDFDIPVTINGDFDNSGIYEHRNNVTTFNGGTQQILGSAAIDFYDLTVNSLTKLTLNRDANVDNDLILSSGILECAANTVYVQGDVTNNANYTDTNAGLVLNGKAQQYLYGTGTWGQLELDNNQGARVEDDITLQKDLILTKGILDINDQLFTLQATSDILGAPFDETKMITSDGVFSNVGLRKYFSIYSGADQTFLFPIGTSGKYTPAELTYSDIGSVGYIRINNINKFHPGVLDNANVLDYYWEIESDGITGFNGSVVLNYLDGDVQVTGANTEADYIAAALLLPGTSWSKASPGAATDRVDETNDLITFNFSGTSSLSGEYTAGIDNALPDLVPEYTSINDGDWSDETNWANTGGDTYPCPVGGPNGFIIHIDSDDVITTDALYASAYRLTIDGELRIDNATYGHNLGTVSGAGTLYLENGTFPAGRFGDFLDCANNATLEYGGSTNYTIIADLYSSVPNLHFTGTGTRTLPNNDLTICNQLLIDGPTLDNSANNSKLTIQGTMERYNTGKFVSGTGSNATVSFAGSAAQTIGGALGDFTGVNAFNNFEINNSAGLTINTSGDIEVSGDLILTNGNIVTTSTNTLTITNTDMNCVSPAGGSSSSYIDGPLTKYINQGDDFLYPIGKGSVLGNKITLSSVRTGTIAWTAEFFTPNATYTDFGAPLTYVNSKEYWTISASSGDQAKVGLDWDPASDLTPLMTQNGTSDMRVANYNAGSTQWEEVSSTPSGDNNNGTVTTTSEVTLPASGTADYTTSCINVTKPRARLNPSGAVCGTDGIPITFTGSALAYDYILTYEKGGILQAPVTITSADVPYTLLTDAAGTTYQLISFIYDEPGNSTTGVVDPSIITTFTVPTTADIGNDGGLDDDDISDCGGTSVANLPGNDPAPYTGLWTVVSGSGGSFVDPTDFDTEFNGTNGTTYELQWTITNGGCSSSDNITIAFPVSNSITLTSAVNTDNQTVCINSAIVDITYSTVGATGATFSGLPTGVTGSWVAGVVTISGTPTVSAGSPYNYTITLTGGCSVPAVTEIGTITVNALPTAIDQTPAPICSEVAGETVQITGLNLRDNDDLITASSGDAVTWYNDAALTSPVADATDVDINDVFGGGTNITEVFYAEVDNSNCKAVATVTYTIYRIPETGPQYHIDNSWGN